MQLPLLPWTSLLTVADVWGRGAARVPQGTAACRFYSGVLCSCVCGLEQQIPNVDHIFQDRNSKVTDVLPICESNLRISFQDTVWKAVPEHYRRLDRCLRRIGAVELPFDAAWIQQLLTWFAGSDSKALLSMSEWSFHSRQRSQTNSRKFCSRWALKPLF